MHLVLAARRRLAAHYGAAYSELSAALDTALAARVAAGIAGLVYDPELGLAELGIPAVAIEPDALVAQLRAIEAALGLRNAIIESLWIIGGPNCVPFGVLANPMSDRDGPLLSDCVYGMASTSELLARWPVGRTPDAEPPEPGLLANLLRLVAAAHQADPSLPGSALGFSAARWATVSTEVFGPASNAGSTLLLAPPVRAGGIDKELLARAQLIYCNLHGVRGNVAWYGQAPGDSELVPALRPDDLAGLRLSGPVVITQACYGARLDGSGAPRSLAIAFLAAGANAFIGALALSYGAPDPPLSESDLLAHRLLRELRAPGSRVGAAMLAAHAAMLRELLRRQGRLDADDTKTLLEFVLYGDPGLSAGRWFER